jgi:hypothetical protein
MRTGTDRTIDLLSRLLPQFIPHPVIERTQEYELTRIDLPPAVEADYFFRLYTEPETQIHAELTVPDSKVNCFWYRPFEISRIPRFNGSCGLSILPDTGDTLNP